MELITLSNTFNEESTERKLWLFSRVDESSGRYSVGYYLDEEGNLTPSNEYAYCFFPTKADTGLHFIIHAPFLLTDSREGIKQGEPHNSRMMESLAELAADSLLYLRDIGIQENHRLITDNILDIIPTKSFGRTSITMMELMFGENVNRKSEYEPFYDKILESLQTKPIIPTSDSYTTADNAYWAYNPSLSSIFDDDALKIITQNKDAEWVFTSISRDKCNHKDLVDKIIKGGFNDNTILNQINAEFIESRSIEWLAKLYKWIDDVKSRKNTCQTLPIFISTDRKAVPAYDNEGKLILFLPTGEDSDYTTISDKLLCNDDIAAFVNHFGIIKPTLKNEIFNKILPRIKNGEEFDSLQCFKKLFDYYCYECQEVDKDNYIKHINEYSFLRYTSSDKEDFLCDTPQNLYFPTEELKEYFSVKPSTKFVDWEGYLDLVGKEHEKILKSFLIQLGVLSSAIIRILPLSDPNSKYSYIWNCSTGDESWSESVIDGCSENIDYIVNNHDSERSIYLWNIIVEIIRTKNHGIKGYDINDLGRFLWVRHKYYYYTDKKEHKNSIDIPKLKREKWLLDKSGRFVSPAEIYVADLSDDYDTTSYAAKSFISFLGILYEDPKLSKLTPEQKKDIELAAKLKEAGIESIEELSVVLKEFDRRKTLSAVSDEDAHIDSDNNSTHSSKIHNSGDTSSNPKPHRTFTLDSEDDVDSDEYTPKTIDYQKKIERAKAKSEAEIDLIEQMEELQQKALDSKRYTFGWFKALLELEARESNENSYNSKEVSISFGRVVPEGPSSRTLILEYPSRYIPRFMEELADIPLILVFENETKKLPIEVISIKSYTLRVKLKPNVDISSIDFTAVKEARITAQNPAFLLDELKNQFAKLEYDDEYNMQENLCENIDFVFGPPGTGKTTYLANEMIIPMMRESKKHRVLVLTPTNKAADVITNKIQEMMGDDTSYTNWFVRFGSTDDESIERAGLLKDKTFDLRELERIVTVTTIDRFPYDFFMPNQERCYIRNQRYDHIIFDEASMIPLVKMIYPLFYKHPERFIVAGDPFQIEPVIHLDMWKGENIYTMVRLDSFADPKTIPYDYEVTPLITQYRSIPVIGDLFSRMTYDGILKHNRNANDKEVIDFGEQLDVKALNIIKFPVSKYESIYRSKALNKKSPYHIYSALFTYEFTLWLAGIINKHNQDKKIRIGVIAPYKAQADMIDRLISSSELPDTISVQTGTIHGFQGDECEIIIAVYNPPPSITSKPDMFLNKKNIINVSISRARDHLFIIMPDDDTENVDDLTLIKKMEDIIKESADYTEYTSEYIEQLLFGRAKYLEENSFATSHQNVNVYGLPEQIYEIRSEDNAIDIQIHKNKR